MIDGGDGDKDDEEIGADRKQDAKYECDDGDDDDYRDVGEETDMM